ncbi:MAG: DeoR/GlpR family DNA-binding transcription regulator [Erysipelotrichaceae bacterium]|nr:DeoR/GlpR family DNA-binding transcription regulator [Erysipelotrichaceae bacterium]
MKDNNIIRLQDYILAKQSATIEELKKEFDFSEATLRRYLKYLKNQKIIETYYGGVKAIIATVSFDNRFDNNIVEKHKIGALASSLIHNGDSVFIDTGTTTIHVIDSLKNVSDVTVITHNMKVINLCKKHHKLRLILLGGEYINDSNCCANYDTIKMMKKYNFDKAFIAANGLSIDKGATNSDSQEHDIKRLAIKQAKENILLVDHTKFGYAGLTTFAQISEFNTIVTDLEPDKSYYDYCHANNINLMIAK